MLLDSGPIQKAKAREGGGGAAMVLSVSCPIRKAEGGGGGRYDRVLGGPGYSTVVEFLRAGINRQCKCAAIIIKCGPKSYQFINGGEGGGGGGARLDVIVVGTLLVCSIWYISVSVAVYVHVGKVR